MGRRSPARGPGEGAVSGLFEAEDVRDPFGLTANPEAYVPTATLQRVLTDTIAALDRNQRSVIVADLDLNLIRRYRSEFGLLRDRRPDLYGSIARIGPPEKGQS